MAEHADRPCACLVSTNISEAKGRYDLGVGQDWFGRRVAFYDDPVLGDVMGIVDRNGSWS